MTENMNYELNHDGLLLDANQFSHSRRDSWTMEILNCEIKLLTTESRVIKLLSSSDGPNRKDQLIRDIKHRATCFAKILFLKNWKMFKWLPLS